MTAAFTNKYIFYATDDTDHQQLLQEVLMETHPNVALVTSESGTELLDFLFKPGIENYQPGLIIFDLGTSASDGIQTVKQVKMREQFNDVPIIAFTDDLNMDARNSVLESGAVAYVVKPSTYRELETIINSFAPYLVDDKNTFTAE